jgi:folylpolyglutamate synthase/dihydropteroate synthase
MDIEKIQELADAIGISSVCVERVEDAKEKAESLTNENSVIIAAGSIFIAGAFREMYIKNV